MRLYKLLELDGDTIRAEVVNYTPHSKLNSIKMLGYYYDGSDNQIIFDIDYDDSLFFCELVISNEIKGSVDLKRARDRVKADIRDKTINSILDESI